MNFEKLEQDARDARARALIELVDHLRRAQMYAHLVRVRCENLSDAVGSAEFRALADDLDAKIEKLDPKVKLGLRDLAESTGKAITTNGNGPEGASPNGARPS
jgi:hypothetical protein